MSISLANVIGCIDLRPELGADVVGRETDLGAIDTQQRLVDRADLAAIADTERLGEVGAAIGIDRGPLAGATDRDIGGAGIDGVDAETLQVGDDVGRRGPLGAVDRADPAGADVAIGKMAKVEHLALAIVLLDQDARSLRIDRDDDRGRAVEALGGVVVPGELHLGTSIYPLV